jgi:hypothetical protein
MNAVLCRYIQRLETADDERLVGVVSTQLKHVHPYHLVASLSRKQVGRK